ncbi:GNAT family N-acetyltransferase [Yinghuangia sp. ASG 101]|uniref:GNAT family N-acetyltransferase n=1 Tax=Yinghuangia sp. ASG 101 TaxID=2896848 RepID=UPI001E48D11E|nr:GNAT family N-acetyltransferase [Yinghuangia sp. ASG 101]UGQ13576.1 GNAT family N-acetyltransferase [Yinghuangia sp. ASG 101]
MTAAPPGIELVRYGLDRASEIRPVLLEVYAEVYADEISADPFFSMARYEQRLDGHTSAPEWEAVVGWHNGVCVGYIYGFQERRDADEFALCELMVRQPWRKTGTAKALHDALITGRSEKRVSLYVEQAHHKVRALYESWGYRFVGAPQPFPDAPAYDELVLRLDAEQ